jgi:hypothetical protein
MAEQQSIKIQLPIYTKYDGTELPLGEVAVQVPIRLQYAEAGKIQITTQPGDITGILGGLFNFEEPSPYFVGPSGLGEICLWVKGDDSPGSWHYLRLLSAAALDLESDAESIEHFNAIVKAVRARPLPDPS